MYKDTYIYIQSNDQKDRIQHNRYFQDGGQIQKKINTFFCDDKIDFNLNVYIRTCPGKLPNTCSQLIKMLDGGQILGEKQ